jgi:hypothetical protein
MLTTEGFIDSNGLPPSPDAPERFNSNIGFAAVAVLVAGQPGMLWESVVEVGRAFASSCGARPVGWMDRPPAARHARPVRRWLRDRIGHPAGVAGTVRH